VLLGDLGLSLEEVVAGTRSASAVGG
jgi:hypothetical protein